MSSKVKSGMRARGIAYLAVCGLISCLLLSACGARHRLPPWCIGLSDARVMRDLNYAHGKEHRLDLVVPGSAIAPVPLIVWIHGGAWRVGDKWDCPAQFLVRNGYAVASINYRLMQDAAFPAQLYDCKAAIRWLRAHADKFNLDAGRIGVWGPSSGGHLSALIGTTCGIGSLEGGLGNNDVSSRVQAVCDLCGPADLVTIGSQAIPGTLFDPNTKNVPQLRLIGGNRRNLKEKLLLASPIAYVSNDDPPFLIMHGDSDTVVPFGQSDELFQALKNAGADVQFITVKHGDHSAFSPDTFQTVLDFFNAKLKKLG